jgi:hypothetical protein
MEKITCKAVRYAKGVGEVEGILGGEKGTTSRSKALGVGGI